MPSSATIDKVRLEGQLAMVNMLPTWNEIFILTVFDHFWYP
jgi:hypothetical protein